MIISSLLGTFVHMLFFYPIWRICQEGLEVALIEQYEEIRRTYITRDVRTVFFN